MYFFLVFVRPYLYYFYMPHLHKKIKNGRPYYYIREIARVDGKPKVVNQVYLGTPDRIMQMASARHDGLLVKIQAQEYGALWLADLIDDDIDIAGIIDSVVPNAKHETGPSVGEYFLYAVLNRMVDFRSNRALPDWFAATAIQQIRAVDTKALTSQRYWKKWDRVDAGQPAEIATRFFQKIGEIESGTADCFMFDTTNYYTFMASDTEAEWPSAAKTRKAEIGCARSGSLCWCQEIPDCPFTIVNTKATVMIRSCFCKLHRSCLLLWMRRVTARRS
jgi:hypothetical protein